MQMDTLPTQSPQADTQAFAETIQYVSLTEVPSVEPTGASLLSNNLQLIQSVKITLNARLGNAEISVGELFALKDGSVVKLDRLTTDPVDILLDGKVVARGKLVATGDHFGISITEIPHTYA